MKLNDLCKYTNKHTHTQKKNTKQNNLIIHEYININKSRERVGCTLPGEIVKARKYPQKN